MSIIYDEKNYPPPFPAGLPSFVEDLKKHIPFVPVRDDSAPVGKDSFDILKGIAFDIAFEDPEKRLETAFADLRRFLGEAGVPEQGSIMRFELADTLEGEDFILTVSPDGLRLEGGSFEGIRRGIYRLMDKISALRTPGLACGSEKKHYWLKNRISRCFFGPIKRPPFNVDELMNDIDYQGLATDPGKERHGEGIKLFGQMSFPYMFPHPRSEEEYKYPWEYREIIGTVKILGIPAEHPQMLRVDLDTVNRKQADYKQHYTK